MVSLGYVEIFQYFTIFRRGRTLWCVSDELYGTVVSPDRDGDEENDIDLNCVWAIIAPNR